MHVNSFMSKGCGSASMQSQSRLGHFIDVKVEASLLVLAIQQPTSFTFAALFLLD